MRIVKYHESLLDECAEFWWSIYRDMPYSHRPDGHQTINIPSVEWPSPGYFTKILKDGFDGVSYWAGDWSPGHGGWATCIRKTTGDTLILVEDKGKIAGILVCSIEEDKNSGNIMSCYVHRDQCGREIANLLLSGALKLFQRMGLHKAIAAPGASRSLEAECPIHLALLDEGFAWEGNCWFPYLPEKQTNEYGVLLGGSLENFCLQAEIKEKIEKLLNNGVVIKRFASDQFIDVYRFDTREKVGAFEGDVTFAALTDGHAVGWLSELKTWEEKTAGIILGGAVPEVIPIYRRKGIGKVLYHLGIEEVVKQGAQYGWTATEIHNPARLIYRSIGYQHWYTSFNMMSKQLS